MSEAVGSSAASPDAGASSTPAEQGATAEGGSTSQAVRLVEPAKVFDKNGAEYDVPQATIDAVEAFKARDGYQQEGFRADSFLYSLGNYERPVHIEQGSSYVAYYHCQVGQCKGKKVIPCSKGSRSNVNKHFKQHGLKGSKGEVRMQNQREREGNIKDALSATRKFTGVGKKRVQELQAEKLVVEKLLPFTFFSRGNTFGEMMATASGNTTFPALPAARVKHLLVELYCATKKVVVGDMAEEVKRAPLPILHHMLDIWTDKGSQRKFMVPNRSRVDEYWVEMVMFLKANFKFIPAYQDIPQIDPKDIRKCLPAKFKGTDEDLLKAEMALDPLSNDAPPAEAGLGL